MQGKFSQPTASLLPFPTSISFRNETNAPAKAQYLRPQLNVLPVEIPNDTLEPDTYGSPTGEEAMIRHILDTFPTVNVIYGDAAPHLEAACSGNHRKTKCIFDYLYK
ncbi:hypothetical protein L873DRAFT_380177 [Choiromyces venosus 120613-1]|uniref:Uncharacterized protein n=1 Tax=Choiromyces venosus 120613-1 TaxID=1336337 RepID=A0A3N4IXY2_9PEZI|nr:hypothetical protein L873DRAFT_380177 [Choiromyces venosus 120613-1]